VNEDDARGRELMAAAGAALEPEEAGLLKLLHRFTRERLGAAEQDRRRIAELLGGGAAAERIGSELHGFLREAWEALDGLGREVNLCMHALFPEAGLYPPTEMTRQCTFYVVRKKLRAHGVTAEHPVTRLLWGETRAEPAEGYQRLSFLYNLSLFLPLELAEGGRLPGDNDVPDAARGSVKARGVPSCPAGEGLAGIIEWLRGFAADCYGRLSSTLTEDPPRR